MAPTTTLTEAYRAFDPRPLQSGDPYFVDLTEARNSHAMVNIRQIIVNSIAANQHAAVAFSGHRGSGKSTELRKLQEALASSCFTLYVDVNEFLDPTDVDYTDLFLLFSRQLLENLLRNGVQLPNELLTSVEGWFKTITKENEESLKLSAGISTEAKAGFEFPFIARRLCEAALRPALHRPAAPHRPAALSREIAPMQEPAAMQVTKLRELRLRAQKAIAPAARSRRQQTRCEEYKPSRRSRAPTPPGTAVSHDVGPTLARSPAPSLPHGRCP